MARRTTNVFFDSELKCGYAYASDGTKFLFDMEDAELVRSRGWHLSKRGYIAGKEKSCERPLHKLMIKADKCFDIDHINRIKTDCRRENLRVCMHQENLFNQSMRSTK